MAGSTIITNLEVEKAIEVVRRAAEDEGFSVVRVGDDELRLQKSNLALSILLGSGEFATPECHRSRVCRRSGHSRTI